ncbi:MAG: DUF4393 domain-containing protein [Lentisphaerae bacterium]|nr:DUF4393 domain-containing protein [Lentisphaerota bacterium]
MSDNKISVIPDVIEPLSHAVQENIPETAKETDGALSTLVGFFNNVVLHPIKKANLTYKYKLENFEKDLKEKTKHIPPENLQEPPVMISGPTLEALRYAYDEKELREMYENLLASAMDNRISTQVHPAFVDAIKQMTPVEAKIIDAIVQNNNQVRCACITFKLKDTHLFYVKAMPDYFVNELYTLGDPFIISASLKNLERLGFITISLLGFEGQSYEDFKTHPYVLERKSMFNKFNQEFEISVNKQAIQLNNYGSLFAEICLSKGK